MDPKPSHYLLLAYRLPFHWLLGLENQWISVGNLILTVLTIQPSDSQNVLTGSNFHLPRKIPHALIAITVKFSLEFVYSRAAKFKLSRTYTYRTTLSGCIYVQHLFRELSVIYLSCRPNLGDIRLACYSR